MKQLIKLISILIAVFLFTGCAAYDNDEQSVQTIETSSVIQVEKESHYTSKEEVASYIIMFGKLPTNYITKSEARDLGWEANEGNLWEVTNQKSIGGDSFGNREGLLPHKEGREYYEADINYEGGYRGPERLVYSNDGLIYYTDDHYDSFILLYGDE